MNEKERRKRERKLEEEKKRRKVRKHAKKLSGGFVWQSMPLN
jgi:hypothetical protein